MIISVLFLVFFVQAERTANGPHKRRTFAPGIIKVDTVISAIGNGDRQKSGGLIALKSLHGQQADIFRKLAESIEHMGCIQGNTIPAPDVMGINVIAGLDEIAFDKTYFPQLFTSSRFHDVLEQQVTAGGSIIEQIRNAFCPEELLDKAHRRDHLLEKLFLSVLVRIELVVLRCEKDFQAA